MVFLHLYMILVMNGGMNNEVKYPGAIGTVERT